MQKLVLMSLVLTTFIWPSVLSRRPHAPGFGGMLVRFVVAVGVYVVLLLFVYPRLF
ncbi:MAG: hypothetical protein Q7V01_13875 [Vicinamibacterales bacterium]|nr:hypothetical protein [Vicinamibacterales bacterium]